MSKVNIYFNGTTYSIDESTLASANTELKNHFSSVMNGSGATIKFGGTSYSIDSTKLDAARNKFIAHLETIAGTGGKVTINGIEYSLDSAKLNTVIDAISTALSDMEVRRRIKENNVKPLADTNGNGAYDVLLFGSGVVDNYGTGVLLTKMLEEGSGIPSCIAHAYMGHDSGTAFNMYELFANSARDSADDYTLSTGASGTAIQEYLNGDGFDLLVLQTGRDYTLKDTAKGNQNVMSAAKIAKLAYDKNPGVKILLLAPYSYYSDYYGFDFFNYTIQTSAQHISYINNEADRMFEAIIEKVPNANVEIAYISDLFDSFIEDSSVITRSELYRSRSEASSALDNTANRASPKGSFLTAYTLYSIIADKSPVGLRNNLDWMTNFDSSIASLSETDALALQKLAYKYALNRNSNITIEIFEEPVLEIKSIKDANDNGRFDAFIFGTSSVMGNNNLAMQFRALTEEGTNLRTSLTSTYTYTASSFNLYELFANPSVEEDYTFSSGYTAQHLSSCIENDSLDIIVLQTGRDSSLSNSALREQNIKSAVKIAKLAYEKNPNIKILLVAPYGLIDYKNDPGTHYLHVELIDNEANAILSAIKTKVPGIDVNLVSLGSLLEYYADSQVEYVNIENLLFADYEVANSLGSYLSACAIYAALTDTSPVGLRYKGASGVTLSAEEALDMQKTAAKFVLNEDSAATVDIFNRNYIATIDMTDYWTLVLDTPGGSRVGSSCATGKIQAGTYTVNGMKRTKSWEWNWSDIKSRFNLDGEDWEYLGATVEIDSNGNMITAPEKSTFYVNIDDITFSDAVHCELSSCPNYHWNLINLNIGLECENNLLNEGGKLVSGWNDKSVKTRTSPLFKDESYTNYHYIFTKAEYINSEGRLVESNMVIGKIDHSMS